QGPGEGARSRAKRGARDGARARDRANRPRHGSGGDRVSLPRGKVIKGSESSAARDAWRFEDGPPAARARVVKEPIAVALAKAAEIVAGAEARGREIVVRAEKQSEGVRAKAKDEGRRDGVLELAEAWVKLRREQADRDAGDLARSIDL